MLLPALLLLGLLIIYPLFYSVWLSLTNQELLVPTAEFVGLENFMRLLSDTRFWNAMVNDIVYTVGTTALSVLFGLAIALLLNKEFRGRGIATTLVIYPYLVPTVVTALAFQWVLHSIFGVVNYFLMWLHLLNTPVAWLAEYPMLSVIVVSVWRFTPFVVILCLARLQTIPDALYEAGKVEGANRWQLFRFVTLPQLRLVLFVAVLLRFIWVFNMFDIIWLLTGGGPAGATEHLPILVYKTMFRTYEVGYASAIAIVMLLVLGVVTVVYFKVNQSGNSGATA